MKFFATILLMCYAATSLVDAQTKPDYNPVIYKSVDINDDFETYRWGIRPPIDIEKGCFYVWFEVKSESTIFIQFSAEEEDGFQESYTIMIGYQDNSLTYIVKGNGQPIFVQPTIDIMTNKKQRFYIQLEDNIWTIGSMDWSHEADVIGMTYDFNNVEAIKYVGVRSEKPSIWKFFLPGFGRHTIPHEGLAEYLSGSYDNSQFTFPKFRNDDGFYIEFGFENLLARIVFSAEYLDDIYEVTFILEDLDNTPSCILQKKKQNRYFELITLDIIASREWRYFWIRYYIDDAGKGNFHLGRFDEDEPVGILIDDDPIPVRNFGITSLDCFSPCLLWLPCEKLQHVCESQTFVMRCDEGLIVVDYALYGRENTEYCSTSQLTKADLNCGDPVKSREVVQEQCRDQQFCSISADTSIFGEPCVGTDKYLEIDYHCDD